MQLFTYNITIFLLSKGGLPPQSYGVYEIGQAAIGDSENQLRVEPDNAEILPGNVTVNVGETASFRLHYTNDAPSTMACYWAIPSTETSSCPLYLEPADTEAKYLPDNNVCAKARQQRYDHTYVFWLQCKIKVFYTVCNIIQVLLCVCTPVP